MKFLLIINVRRAIPLKLCSIKRSRHTKHRQAQGSLEKVKTHEKNQTRCC